MFQMSTLQSIEHIKEKISHQVKGYVSSNGKDSVLKFKYSEKFQPHFVQVILNFFLIFSAFWVGHLCRSV